MGDLKNPKLIYLKAGLFLLIGLMSGGLLLLDHPQWRTVVLLVLTVWGFARLYYFMFYVIGHYVDPSYRFAGVASFLAFVVRKRKT